MFFRIIKVWPEIPTTAEFLNSPVFLTTNVWLTLFRIINVFSGLLRFGQKLQYLYVDEEIHFENILHVRYGQESWHVATGPDMWPWVLTCGHES